MAEQRQKFDRIRICTDTGKISMILIPNTTKTLQRTTDMTCSIVSPASKVESIPPTLAGLVEVSLVVQQLNHTLQMRKQLACERKQLACESTTLHGDCIMATITLLEVIAPTTKKSLH